MRLKPSSPGPNNQPPSFPVSWKTGSHQDPPRNPGTPQGIETTNPNLSGPWCWMASARILLRKVVFFLWRCAYRAFVMLCLGSDVLVGWKKIGLKGSETPKKTPCEKKLSELVYTSEKVPCDLWGNGDVPEKTTTRKWPKWPQNAWESPDGNRCHRWRWWNFQLASKMLFFLQRFQLYI